MRTVLFGILFIVAATASAEAKKVDCGNVAIINSAHKKTRLHIEDYNAREEHRLITTTEERFKALKKLATAINNQVERLSTLLENSTHIAQVDDAKEALLSTAATAENVKFYGSLIEDHSHNFTALIKESGCRKDQLTMCLFEKTTHAKLTHGITPLIRINDLRKLRAAKQVVLLPCVSNGLIRNNNLR